MTKNDLMGGVKLQPVPFTTPGGATLDLRPLTFGDRSRCLTWWNEHKDEPHAGLTLMRKYLALGLSDADGAPMFTEDEVDSINLSALDLDAIGKEIGARAGLANREGEAGKASPAATPN